MSSLRIFNILTASTKKSNSIIWARPTTGNPSICASSMARATPSKPLKKRAIVLPYSSTTPFTRASPTASMPALFGSINGSELANL